MLVMEVVRARQLKSPASGTPLCKAAHKNGTLTIGDFVSARPHAPVIASLLARSNSMFLYCFLPLASQVLLKSRALEFSDVISPTIHF